MRKIIMTVAAVVVCAFALTACGGDGDDSDSSSASTRADEGIWSYTSTNQIGDQNVLQTVILSDGSYWGVYGDYDIKGCFQGSDVLHGTASVSGNNASGTYMDFGYVFDSFGSTNTSINGAYAGTVSAQSNFNLTFNDGSTTSDMVSLSNINMSYDSIYNQPASLASIAGNYPQALNGCINSGGPLLLPGQTPILSASYTLSISGSNLSLVQSYNGSTNVVMTGTIAPHGTTVNVFDVSLTGTSAAAASNGPSWSIPVGVTFTGILFQTSGILKNNIELVATTADNSSALFYMGTK